MNPIDRIEAEQLRKDVPPFKPGDTVRVHVKVVEGDKERIQVFEGTVLGRSGSKNRETFTGPQDVLRRRRRAHLPGALAAHRQDRDHAPAARSAARSSYLRDRAGRAARVTEDTSARRSAPTRDTSRVRGGTGGWALGGPPERSGRGRRSRRSKASTRRHARDGSPNARPTARLPPRMWGELRPIQKSVATERGEPAKDSCVPGLPRSASPGRGMPVARVRALHSRSLTPTQDEVLGRNSGARAARARSIANRPRRRTVDWPLIAQRPRRSRLPRSRGRASARRRRASARADLDLRPTPAPRRAPRRAR